jgi:hypothetical protein
MILVIDVIIRGICLDFFLCTILYSTLLHLPPLRFHCVGGCGDRTQDCCVFGIALTTRLDLIHIRLDLIKIFIPYFLHIRRQKMLNLITE